MCCACCRAFLVVALLLCMPTLAAKPKPAATCTLQVFGQPRKAKNGIASAWLKCTGGLVRVVVDEALLGKFKSNFTGVTWGNQQCKVLAAQYQCVFTVCPGTRVILSNSVVKGLSGKFGSVVCLIGSKVRISNTTVASNAGNGIMVTNSSVSFTGITVITNNRGVGILGEARSIINITGNTLITKHDASGHGGGVSVKANSTLWIGGNASVSNNTALTGDGGGVYVGSYSNVTIAGQASISGNVAQSNGGGLAVNSTSIVSIRDGASISNNKCVGPGDNSNGGGVFVNVNSSVSIGDEVSISGNTCTGDGAGIGVNDNSLIKITGSVQIAHNKGSQVGAGVWLGKNTTSHVAGNVVITNNSAEFSGGGVYVFHFAKATIGDNVSITHNTASSGGGLYAYSDCEVTVAGNVNINR